MAKPSSNPAPSAWRRLARWATWLVAGAAALLVVAGAAAWWSLRASLPLLDGARPLPGLAAPVSVERDALGVPTIRGVGRLDVARATGFLHAQERFFQTDLLRRRAAGELSELVGPAALPVDRRTRVHRFRAVARRALEGQTADERALLEAYAAGVEAGLAALGARPFEYLLLRTAPSRWLPEDSLLVILAMFIDLHGERDEHDAARAALRDTLPAPLVELLAPLEDEWDAPLQGGPPPPPSLPGPEVIDLRGGGPAPGAPRSIAGPRDAAGSNAWAVDGAHSTHGGALLADDMHLTLGVPTIWYRASFSWREGEVERRITGVTLPGVPAVVAGSNGQVAWGFTNSYGDWQDLVELEASPGAPDQYLTPQGPRSLERIAEVIRVKGGADEALTVLGTIWGPIVSDDGRGQRRALLWTASQPGAVGLGLLALERAATLDQALAAANAAGIPPQNFLCADAAGRIGWTIAGRLPRRSGFDGRLPVSFADGRRRWDGLREPGETPRIVDPPGGRLWTANARVVGGAALELVGDGGYALGARARQIGQDLQARPVFSERDLLAIQLDDRAPFLARWQALLLQVLEPAAVAADPRRAEVRRLVEGWGGRAAVGSAGYRLVRGWRLAVTTRALAPFLSGARRLRPELGGVPGRSEALVWRLVAERPAHLLAPAEGSWERLLLAALDDTLAALPGRGADLGTRTWGERNTAAIRHPLSGAVPGLSRLLDMPAEPLPGDSNLPRVQTPTFGASERFVVSPGREAEGLFQMPGGQSGHPLSPYYRAGHQAWVRGEPTPFLPGPAQHRLTLTP